MMSMAAMFLVALGVAAALSGTSRESLSPAVCELVGLVRNIVVYSMAINSYLC